MLSKVGFVFFTEAAISPAILRPRTLNFGQFNPEIISSFLDMKAFASANHSAHVLEFSCEDQLCNVNSVFSGVPWGRGLQASCLERVGWRSSRGGGLEARSPAHPQITKKM